MIIIQGFSDPTGLFNKNNTICIKLKIKDRQYQITRNIFKFYCKFLITATFTLAQCLNILNNLQPLLKLLKSTYYRVLNKRILKLIIEK